MVRRWVYASLPWSVGGYPFLGVCLPVCVTVVYASPCVYNSVYEAHRGLPAPMGVRVNVSYALPAQRGVRVNVSYARPGPGAWRSEG